MWQALAERLRLLANQFLETLLVAVAMNLLFWFVVCQLHWDTRLAVSVQKYMWGFTKDVFGICAGSGYMAEWGLQCLPFALSARVPIVMDRGDLPMHPHGGVSALLE